MHARTHTPECKAVGSRPGSAPKFRKQAPSSGRQPRPRAQQRKRGAGGRRTRDQPPAPAPSPTAPAGVPTVLTARTHPGGGQQQLGVAGHHQDAAHEPAVREAEGEPSSGALLGRPPGPWSSVFPAPPRPSPLLPAPRPSPTPPPPQPQRKLRRDHREPDSAEQAGGAQRVFLRANGTAACRPEPRGSAQPSPAVLPTLCSPVWPVPHSRAAGKVQELLCGCSRCLATAETFPAGP